MASFIETGIDYSRIEDLQYMRRYIMMLNDDLRYMFCNIDPEDNFSEEGLQEYLALDDAIADCRLSTDGLNITLTDVDQRISAGIKQMDDNISLYVETGKVTQAINISPEVWEINAARLHITSDNFVVDPDQHKMKVVGQIIATGGSIGAFTLEKDSGGKEYLKGGNGSKLSAGTVYGATGDFGSLTCTGDVVMNNNTWYMWACRVSSNNLEFTGSGFETGALDIARWSENQDMYTAWYPFTCEDSIHAGDIHVGRNGDDSGTVRCRSVYSYFEGAERPDTYDYSDRRLKKNITELSSEMACSFLEAVRPVRYKLYDDDREQMGVIAQDIEELQLRYGDIGIISKYEEYLTVNYARFIPILAAALKRTGEEINKWQFMRTR